MKKNQYLTRKLLIITLTLFSISGSLYAGKVYKWTDENGVIHYSDIKPTNTSAKSLKIKTGKSNNSRSSAQEQTKKLDETKTQQLATQAQKLQEETNKRENDARCQAVRDNLLKFKENSRIRINENGELRYLSPEEISAKTSEFEKILKDDCS